MADLARDLIKDRRLACLFQPIVHARQRSVLGYEALARGPSDSTLHSPGALFEAARREGVLPESIAFALNWRLRAKSHWGYRADYS